MQKSRRHNSPLLQCNTIWGVGVGLGGGGGSRISPAYANIVMCGVGETPTGLEREDVAGIYLLMSS